MRSIYVKYEGRLQEYNISALGIMVLCKACDRYLELLYDNENNSLTLNERIIERKIILFTIMFRMNKIMTKMVMMWS